VARCHHPRTTIEVGIPGARIAISITVSPRAGSRRVTKRALEQGG
jgi:hypothetical protein